LCFQASVFLTSSKHKNTHIGCQEPPSDHKNSLHVNKEINAHSFEKYTGTNRV
jgi:hypothetical protein